MRGGRLEQKIDRLEAGAEMDMEAAYDEAITNAFRKHREPLKRMQAIMDGIEKPPRRCVTDQQKARWKEKTLMKLLNEASLDSDIALEFGKAGKTCVKRIQKFGLDVYNEAYKGTMDKLKG